MFTEVELRFVHVDVPALERRLEEAGATFLSRVTLREVRFAGLSGSPVEYIRARHDGRIVRLQHKAHDPEGHGAIERELPLDGGTDLEAAVEFLAGLGLKRQLLIERRRTQWAFGPAIVSVDQFPGIPPHVEVEAESLDDVHAACAQLGLDPKDHAGMGIADIYRHYGVTLQQGDIAFSGEERRALPPPRFG
jgi:adenylate cyclase class 2